VTVVRTTARATAASAGWGWRMFWWIVFPPVGLLLSWQHGKRVRHRQTIRATTRVEVAVREHAATVDQRLAAMRREGMPCPGC